MTQRVPVRGAALAAAWAAVLCLAGGDAAASAQNAVHAVSITGRTSVSDARSRSVFIDTGTVSGSPIGSGAITLTYRLDPSRGTALTTFTIRNRRGTVSGRCRSDYSVTRLHITFTGAAAITDGTGAYRGIRGRPLEFNAVHSATGQRELIAFLGRATTPSPRTRG